MSDIKVELGKFYRTRGGSKALVYNIEPLSIFPVSVVTIGTDHTYATQLNGMFLANGEERVDDLIEEWKD